MYRTITVREDVWAITLPKPRWPRFLRRAELRPCRWCHTLRPLRTMVRGPHLRRLLHPALPPPLLAGHGVARVDKTRCPKNSAIAKSAKPDIRTKPQIPAPRAEIVILRRA